jgi:hypothetical protein
MLVAPHLRSVLILRPAGDDVAAAAEEVRVLVVEEEEARVLVLVVRGRVEVEVAMLLRADEVDTVLGAALTREDDDEEAPEPGHFPNNGLHPVPQ